MCIRDRAQQRLQQMSGSTSQRGGQSGSSGRQQQVSDLRPVSYTHLRAHETPEHLVCRLLLEKKKKKYNLFFLLYFYIFIFFFFFFFFNDTATTEIYTRSLVGSVRCV